MYSWLILLSTKILELPPIFLWKYFSAQQYLNNASVSGVDCAVLVPQCQKGYNKTRKPEEESNVDHQVHEPSISESKD